jgi:lysophospholipase L1-like esterase
VLGFIVFIEFRLYLSAPEIKNINPTGKNIIFKGIMGKRHLMSDPIHPNDAGYAIFAKKFYEKMKPYL